ncbi:Fumarate reductase subunit D [Candidatus Providencia siddallii]|uniref:Fumarate reductase subunit D n=1 Tax=Candidatus Providencia siddallii TaxID=1715285 RepID=A0A0M6W906_9GAMM|nr:Fumarate reductase subunit D [Candidatus Providencia siddallii]
MMNSTYKRSNEPIFWALFSAGGMWSAIINPILIILIGFLIPIGIIHKMVFYNQFLVFYQNVIGKIFLLLVIIFPVWCGMHRIHHTLRDVKIYVPKSKVIFYGISIFITQIAFICIFML